MNIKWDKDGLVPAIVQDAETRQVLMLGYMNSDSYQLTQQTGRVTFYSRSRQSLWVKGETSGNYLTVVDIQADCDQDALLILAKPEGPTCHRNTQTCFDSNLAFLTELEETIKNRIKQSSSESYVFRLTQQGLDRVAQKVGEEAIETVIASKNQDLEKFEGEAADLLFHLMVLCEIKETSLAQVVSCLKKRSK
jgi:phosphoribosyl-AMP cyclohydrolase / phosphoribosyl-ATP pyrophosphohydrolase